MRRYGWLMIFLFLRVFGWAQAPEHDACTQALTLSLGTFLPQENNAGATTTAVETPEGEPVTCIKTFENDLWVSIYHRGWLQPL
jgi:hypothetical protein